ncbi:hypothetical protein OG394_36220 [Kribbella sp. NBC_01245]|uniref:hypothetical protein n=1 Tax=Kribbella sp. NBC_01245 TaxID=2903578 RepID=UPI002E2E4BA3|nr:hypothetical protein [Kribbella sp. NBC_01245]
MAAGVVAVLLTSLAVPVAGATSTASARSNSQVGQGDDWTVKPAAGGFLITKRLDAPVRMRAALPLLAIDGVPVGVARQSPDGRTLTVLSTNPAVTTAKSVELMWSSEINEQAGRSTASTESPDWSKAALGKALAVDPGSTGRFKVDISEYNLGNEALFLSGIKAKSEVAGRVYTPRGATGKRPLVVFLHGRHSVCYGKQSGPDPVKPWPCPKGQKAIPSYKGYDAPAKALASHGYLVVSISANAINAYDGEVFDAGALARGQLVLAHLDLFNKWSTVGGGPFGKRYVGKVDLRRVGLMGHSRGGEGVVRAALLNSERGRKYGIRAVLPLAPVDFARATLPDTAMSVILPYCDGDVSDLQGQHFYDDTRYSVTGDRAARSTVLVMGANHNYFNTQWTPGRSVAPSWDDWGGASKTAPCGSASAPRLKPTEQEAVGRAYIGGFFRLELGGESALLPLFDGSTTRAASAGRAVVRVVSQAPANRRYDLARLDRALPAGSVTGKAVARLCTGLKFTEPRGGHLAANTASTASTASTACRTTDDPSQFPHWTPAAIAAVAPTTTVTNLSWTGTTGSMRINLAPKLRDVRRFSALSFRAAPDASVRLKTDLTVRVRDGKGRVVDVPVSSVSDALSKLPGQNRGGLPKMMLRTVRIPLTSLAKLDLRDIRSVEFVTNKAATGSVFLSDVVFSKPWMSRPQPPAQPIASVNDVTMKEGDSGTKSAVFTIRLSKASRVPVTVFAETAGWFTDVVGATARRVVFAPGVTTVKFAVPIHPNKHDGEDQRFDVLLSNPTQAIVGDSFGAGKVLDDDPPPMVQIGPGVGTEGPEKTVSFPVKLSLPSDRGVQLTGELISGTATLGKDFTSPEDDGAGVPEKPIYGFVAEGSTTGEILVPITDDRLAEPDETLTLKITAVDGGILKVPTTYPGTIHDND